MARLWSLGIAQAGPHPSTTDPLLDGTPGLRHLWVRGCLIGPRDGNGHDLHRRLPATITELLSDWIDQTDIDRARGLEQLRPPPGDEPAAGYFVGDHLPG